MDYKIYRMNFSTGLHIGNGKLTDQAETIQADTLFSALCHMALRSEGSQAIERLVSWVKNGELLLSDAFPYIGDTYYLPKPILRFKVNQVQDSSMKKILKNMPFIPLNRFDDYIQGKMNIEKEVAKLEKLGQKVTSSHASVTGQEEMVPYSVGSYHFNCGSGLYICLAYMGECICEEVEEWLEYLGIEGIGGRRSSGLGKFDIYKEKKLPDNLRIRLDNWKNARIRMSLAVSMAADEELENVIEEASYMLQRRGGYIDSDNYSDRPAKKKDFFSFKSGSCFSVPFEGDIYDVSESGTHPVYRYGKPLFMEV